MLSSQLRRRARSQSGCVCAATWRARSEGRRTLRVARGRNSQSRQDRRARPRRRFILQDARRKLRGLRWLLSHRESRLEVPDTSRSSSSFTLNSRATNFLTGSASNAQVPFLCPFQAITGRLLFWIPATIIWPEGLDKFCNWPRPPRGNAVWRHEVVGS